MLMKRTPILEFIILVGLAVAASKGGAQTPEGGTGLDQSRSELWEAKEALEAAAREVARLSAQVTGPFAKAFYMAERRAVLGINISDSEDGVRVDGVTPGGPATESGIETGDIIIAMDGAALSGDFPSRLLIAQMGNVDPGDTVTLTLARNGDTQDVEVITRELVPGWSEWGKSTPLMPGLGGGFSKFGPTPAFGAFYRARRWRDMELVELTPELGSYFGTNAGILVVRAPSYVSQLEDGDVIVEVSERIPNSIAHTMRILGSFDPGEILKLTIMRDQKRQTLEIVLPEGVQEN
jgi:S1-C subfamily serine protease